jgi:drug/metabolite transporter (DMT)-like permease
MGNRHWALGKLPPPEKGYFISGILICLLGAICFSTKAIFVKLAYRDTPVDAVTLLALRMIFSLPFFVISAITTSSRQGNVRFSGKQWFYVALIGCLGYYISSLLDFLGLQYVSAGIERLILFIYPTLVLLIAAVLFRDKISQRQWMAVAVTYAGLVVAFVAEADFTATGNDHFMLGVLLIFTCAITYALYIVGSGRLIPQVGAAKFNSYAMSFACAAVLLHFWITSPGQSLLHHEWLVYVYSALMAILSTVIPSYLVSEGIKRIGSDNAAIVGSVGPISTILQAYFLLGEPVSVLQIAGTLLVLAGILLIGKR